MACGFPALPARRTSRRRFHSSGWTRRVAEQDQSRAWIRTGNLYCGPDVRHRGTFLQQSLRYRCERFRGDEDSFPQRCAIPSFRQRASSPDASTVIADNVRTCVSAGETSRACRVERRSAPNFDAFTSQHRPQLHIRRWPAQAREQSSSPPL